MRARFLLLLLLFCVLVVVASPLMAKQAAPLAGFTVSLSNNLGSPQPLGTSVQFTANVSGDPDPNPVYEYQFTAQPVGFPTQVRRGYGHTKNITLTPTAFETTFTVGVNVKNVHAGTSGSTSKNFQFTSRLVSGHAAVNTTNHPLVAFFSAQACQIPNSMRVRFTPAGNVPPGGISTAQTTNTIPCRVDTQSSSPDQTSMNFEIAGMYPMTAYNMHWEVVNPSGTTINTGTDYGFTTGAIPATVHFPAFTATGTSGDVGEPIVLHNVVTIPVNGTIYTSAATDLAGNVLWYAANAPTRTEVGGNYWAFVGGTDPYIAGIAEYDLAGNVVVQTTVGAVDEQLVAAGKRPVTSFHHEVRRITTPNGAAPAGNVLTIGAPEYICTNCQGGTPQVPVDVIGDMIIVLDSNMNLTWSWDAFDYLDINNTAILNEQCFQPGGAGCEPFNPNFNVANDWLHTNSAQYTAYDGNIIFSERHQDAVMKINYDNGSGDGHVIWELGNPKPTSTTSIIGGTGGTPLPQFALFTNGTSGPDLGYPWFSHQHDTEVELKGHVFPGGTRVMTIFDDGNTRQAFFNANADSRCQIYAINESTRVANLNTNGDMGSYSFAVGSAQLLKNGSIHCDSGFIGGFAHAMTDPLTESVELDQAGNFVYKLDAGQDSYRTFRMADLYTAITP